MVWTSIEVTESAGQQLFSDQWPDALAAVSLQLYDHRQSAFGSAIVDVSFMNIVQSMFSACPSAMTALILCRLCWMPAKTVPQFVEFLLTHTPGCPVAAVPWKPMIV